MSRVRVVARAGGSATIIEAEAAMVVAVDGKKGTTWRNGDPDRFADLLLALFDRFQEQGNAEMELSHLLLSLPSEVLDAAMKIVLSKPRFKGGPL